MYLRVSIPDAAADVAEIDDFVGTVPDPTYGTQLRDFTLPGHPAEYRLQIKYEEHGVVLAEGEMVRLRAPTYTAGDLGYGPLHP